MLVCFKVVEMKQLFTICTRLVVKLQSPEVVWAGRGWQNLSESSIIAGGDYPPLVAQLFGQWHRRASRGPYICCWVGVDRVICGFVQHNSQYRADCSRRTQTHKTRGQRARSDILSGNEFEIEVDFISAAALLIWEKRERAVGNILKCKLVIIGLIFLLVGAWEEFSLCWCRGSDGNWIIQMVVIET